MKKFPVLSKIKSLNDRLGNYQPKIYTTYYSNLTITNGYLILDYPSGISNNTHFIVIQQSYNGGNVVGCTFTIQVSANNIIVYVRVPGYTNGLPPDGSKVSFYVHFIKA